MLMFLESTWTVGDICTLVSTLAAVIPSLIGLIVFVIRTIKNKDWDTLKEIADTAMKTAEAEARKNPGMTGEQKLDMALEIIQESAKVAGIKITDAILDQIRIYIKHTINWFNDMKK